MRADGVTAADTSLGAFEGASLAAPSLSDSRATVKTSPTSSEAATEGELEGGRTPAPMDEIVDSTEPKKVGTSPALDEVLPAEETGADAREEDKQNPSTAQATATLACDIVQAGGPVSGDIEGASSEDASKRVSKRRRPEQSPDEKVTAGSATGGHEVNDPIAPLSAGVEGDGKHGSEDGRKHGSEDGPAEAAKGRKSTTVKMPETPTPTPSSKQNKRRSSTITSAIEGGWTMRDGTAVVPCRQAEDVEEEERCMPEEEEMTMVVRDYVTQPSQSGNRKKKAKLSQGGANFKKFRKNRVIYGKDPFLHETVKLETVSAEDNERVEQLRREEQEAEEYERQAELLFNDNDTRSTRKPATKRGRR